MNTPVLKLSKITKDPLSDDRSVYSVYTYQGFSQGYGFCIHTYETDGNPPPSFGGDPYLVALGSGVDNIAEAYWSTLDKANKVALAAKAIDVNTGEVSVRVINKQ